MDKKVSFEMEILIEKGRGYVPAEDNSKEDTALGTIAIDSIFTPIKNVKYDVENYRVEQKTDFEKLNIHLVTDGSITPKDALTEASKILIQHFLLFSDEKITFDKTSSVYLTGTNHTENQPVHLKLKDQELPIKYTLDKFDEPAQRYCPVGVYEVQRDQQNSNPKFVINSQNCIHCKTCDIKEPSQNITWVTPEGSGGPRYGNM